MSSKNSALMALTATYTDSENEDERDSASDSSNSDDSTAESDYRVESLTISPKPKQDKLIVGNNILSSKSTRRLVSYNDDNIDNDGDDDDDDENVSPNMETINMEISEDETSQEQNDKNNAKKDQFAEYGFLLPAEPKGKCSQDLQEKVTNMYDKMKSGMDMNKLIQERKEFPNPSIYEKLIQYCDIDELGTNYQPEIYDPLQWGKESFFEELAKVQKTEMEKREKDRKENVKQELVIAAAKKAEEEAKKRKSKWDQPAPSASQTQTAPLGKPVSIPATIQPSITTGTATGTKGTVISAFGSLPNQKKPKV